MDFNFSDIQTEFRNTLRRFFNGHAGQKRLETPASFWRNKGWSQFADLGSIAALLPEVYGGMGGDDTDPVDIIVLMDEIGRAQASVPMIETAVIGAGLINRLGDERQRQEFLPEIAGGRLKTAFAGGGFHAPGTAFKSQKLSSGKFQIDGQQDIVFEASECHQLLILAGDAAMSGVTLFGLQPDHPGLRIQPFSTLDDRPAARVTATEVICDPSLIIGSPGGASDIVLDILDLAVLAQCAEACGLIASLLNQTITHLKTRIQFGQPLANFQALQHRLVDAYTAYELSLSLTYKAAILCRDSCIQTRQEAVSAAKVQVFTTARFVGLEAIQMHGAMGMSLELPVGHHVKRLRNMEPQCGTVADHLHRFKTLAPVRVG